jgi:hypothetical protein
MLFKEVYHYWLEYFRSSFQPKIIKLSLTINWQLEQICHLFHQHFMSSFSTKILSPKNYKPKL